MEKALIDRNNHLNIFRLLFALQVVYRHACYWLELPTGGLFHTVMKLFPGVPLFFMVSGFLITDSYINSRTLRDFYLKRVLRIYPALLVNILVLEVAMLIGGNMSDNGVSILKYGIYFAVYVVTASSGIAAAVIGIEPSSMYQYSGFFDAYPSRVLWTLTVELSFYLLIPALLAIKGSRVRNTALLTFVAIALAMSSQLSYEYYSSGKLQKLIGISVFPYFWIFGIGIFMRLYWAKVKTFIVGKGVAYLGIYFAYCFGLHYLLGGTESYLETLAPATAVQIILLALAMFSMAFSYTKLKIIRKLDLSYSTYLFHMLVVQIMLGLGLKQDPYLYVVVVVATLVIAYLSWTFVEKPILSLKGRLSTIVERAWFRDFNRK